MCSQSRRSFMTKSGLKSTSSDSCWQLNKGNKAKKNEDIVAGQAHYLSDHIAQYSVWKMRLALPPRERSEQGQQAY